MVTSMTTSNNSMEYKFKVVRPSTEETADIIDPHNDFLQQSYEMAEEATPRPTKCPKLPGLEPPDRPEIFINDEQLDLSPMKTPTTSKHFILNGTDSLAAEQQLQGDEKEEQEEDGTASDSVSLSSEDSSLSSDIHTPVQCHHIPQITGELVSELQPSAEVFGGEDRKFNFRITIIQATGIPWEYADVFIQFKFLTGTEKVYSTEPLHNDHHELAMGFYHMQNFTVTVTEDFLSYLRHCPLLFEVYGHYQKHPFHNDPQLPLTPISGRKLSNTNSPAKQRAPSPVRSPKTNVFDASGSMHSFAEVDILAHFEILELGADGEYNPVPVNHDAQAGGCFLLQQGIQRRVRVRLLYEADSELYWSRVEEIVIGRIRETLDPVTESDQINSVVSLSAFTPYLDGPNDDEILCYTIECAWDSSLHENILLNRVTPSGKNVFITVSLYVEFDNGTQPACFTRDIQLKINSRDSKPSPPWSLRNFFSGKKLGPDDYRCTSFFSVSLRRTREKTPDRQQLSLAAPVDPFVQQERTPRRNKAAAILADHQELLLKLQMIEDSEKSRHILHLRQRLHDLSKMMGDAQVFPKYCELTLSDEEKAELTKKCVELLSNGIGDDEFAADDDVLSVAASSFTSISQRSDTQSLLSPLCVPEVHDKTYIKSTAVTKKGFLLFLCEESREWTKKYVVVKRPYVLLYNSDNDLVERGLINLSKTKVELSKSEPEGNGMSRSFSLFTKYRSIVVQSSEKDFMDWLNALDSLLAGKLRSQNNSSKK